MKHFCLLVLLSACFLISCKKDKDTTDSVITIYSPYSNQAFNVFDTVHLNVKVSDETKLTNVSVVLQDMNSVNVMNSVAVSVQSSSFQFQLDYILGDIHINSGNYSIVVMAGDGTNTKIAGKTIYITAVPLQKKYFYFATEVGNSTTITRVDSVFANPQLLNFNGKFVAMRSSSWNQRLYVAGEVNADFNCYFAVNNQLSWSIHDMGAGYPYFSSLGTDGQNVMVGFMDGRLQQYDNTGNISVNYQTAAGSYYPEFMYVTGNYCYAGLKDKLSAGRYFKRFSRTGGYQQSQYGVNWSPVAMADKSSVQAYVLGNDNTGQAVLNVYDATTNSFYSPQNLPAGSALCGAGIDNDYFIIAHSNGTIYRYQYSTNSLVSIYSGLTASKMIYNSDFNELYVSAGSNFYIFNVMPYALQFKQGYPHSGNIDDFAVMFNK